MTNNIISSSDWQEILQLGYELLKLSSLDTKINVMVGFVESQLHCKTEIKITDPHLGVFITTSRPAENEKSDEEVIVANEISDSTQVVEETKIQQSGTQILIPLIAGDHRIGSVLFSRKDKPFLDEEILYLQGIAFQTSISLENYLLYEDSQRLAIRLSSVSEIGNVIASILDIDLLLSSIANLINKYFRYPYVYVFTIHYGQNSVLLRAASAVNQSIEIEDYDYPLSEENLELIQLIQRRETVVNNIKTSETIFKQLPPEGSRSELIVPLIFGDHVLGLLCLRSEEENAFNDSDIFILETLGDNIAIALRNANLYSTEQWRRQVAESMRDVAGLLSADIDLDNLLNQLLAEIIKTLPCETAAIWLFDTNSGETNESSLTSSLLLAAIHSTNISVTAVTDQIKILPSEPWLVDILEHNYPKIRDPNSKIEPFGEMFGYPGDYSLIISPLRIGLQPLGILVLAHPTPGRYGSEAQLITATFASYSAIAIKNTQLYEAAHDQAWVSTVLLQVAEATQSINDLSDLIQTIVEIIPQLVGVQACGLLLWDRGSEAFVPSASHGLTAEREEAFTKWYIPKGNIAVLDVMLTSREPVILLQSFFSDSVDKDLYDLFNLDQGLFVLFPMISPQDIQGAILVDFSEDNSEYDYDLWDEKISIIQGIAYQTAIAIENIRLLQSQEEEAYISIALLQVAQAIVSATEIGEALSVITRITPILVAIRRCVIFLWDFQKMAFVLSQSYGISRGEILSNSEALSPEEFPLLEMARDSNQIACHLFEDSGFSFSHWSSIKSEDCILVTSPSSNHKETDDIVLKELLSSKQGLLLAYPLSIKQTVYGVLVAEEELSEIGYPSYHIRERRMEILLGITQQAALAIQNDILLGEAVQREMFDRELQLAREIQQNFMPDILPHVDGWELDVKWLPARQVGGDYFDVFVLPRNRVGLVIADVADKGMPAALFMTLVRTLIRATARDDRSPSEALREVNELLVPDAKNGMFVTITYAILSPETGKLVYANAGHVPPILFNSSRKYVNELLPNSMALGVFSGIDVGELEIEIPPGDSLLFYTDGVSEAFSPSGDMYGSERLKNLLISQDKTASELLDQIIKTVSDFSGDAAIYDDITMVALRRTGD